MVKFVSFSYIFLCYASVTYVFTPLCYCHLQIQGRDFWYKSAHDAIAKRLQHSSGGGRVARNIIMFVGDGMGMSTLTAARILKGQRTGGAGEDAELIWETFPAVALSKTYNADAQIGESSACATALMCGVKANYQTLGADDSLRYGDCPSTFQARVPSLLTWAQDQGKETGLVTNARVSHATPAALFAHSPNRFWEDDSKVDLQARTKCKDIARQLVEDEPGSKLKVILGGGRRHFTSIATLDPEAPNREGKRLDGRNLIEDWLRDKRRTGYNASYVYNTEQLLSVDPMKTDYLMGLFASSHMEFEAERDTSLDGDPSLAEMTVKALEMLSANDEGFFLMVEGGRIDHAHHLNNAFRALDETLSLEAAVAAALQMVNLNNTLILVTSDHSHAMTLAGYATARGNSIFGYDREPSDIDMRPYTTLLYANGPGGVRKPKRSGRSETRNRRSAKHRDAVQRAAVPRGWATHAGEDVPVYAIGPMAVELFSGTIDQTYIPHAICRSACMGHYSSICNTAKPLQAKKEDTYSYGVEKKAPFSREDEESLKYPENLEKINTEYFIVDKGKVIVDTDFEPFSFNGVKQEFVLHWSSILIVELLVMIINFSIF